MSRTGALQISSLKAGAALTPQQKRFNLLIRQIEQARQSLAAWQLNTQAYRQAHDKVLRPLQAQLIAGHRQWLFALDALLDKRNWTKAERQTLRERLCDEVRESLNEGDDDPELKALFDKHAQIDYDTDRREMMQTMKGFTEAVTGLDLGDEAGIDSQEDLFARIRQGLQDRTAAEATDEAQYGAKATCRRKNAAQLRQEAQAQQATQSVREIYRKLASALHPDRETDAQQREEKTALMKRVNLAYEANDLLALLELQLQIEQIDASHIAKTSAERLKLYNQVLAAQLGELTFQVSRLRMDFLSEFELEPVWSINPRRVGLLIHQTARQWRADLNQQQRDIQMLRDVAATRRWLKHAQQLLREADFDFDSEPF